MSPIVTHLLAAVRVFAVAVGILIGAQSVLASLLVGWLRRRYPTLPEQRAYLLQSMFHPPAHLDEGQRLESIRQNRGKIGALGYAPVLFLDEILSRCLGVMHFDHVALTIEWVGLIVCVPLVFGVAFVTARARLAGDVSGRPPVPMATVSPA